MCPSPSGPRAYAGVGAPPAREAAVPPAEPGRRCRSEPRRRAGRSSARATAQASGLPPKVLPCSAAPEQPAALVGADDGRDRDDAAAQRLAEPPQVRGHALVVAGEQSARLRAELGPESRPGRSGAPSAARRARAPRPRSAPRGGMITPASPSTASTRNATVSSSSAASRACEVAERNPLEPRRVWARTHRSRRTGSSEHHDDDRSSCAPSRYVAVGQDYDPGASPRAAAPRRRHSRSCGAALLAVSTASAPVFIGSTADAVLASLSLAGLRQNDDEPTSSSGQASAGDDALNSKAQAMVRKAQTAIKTVRWPTTTARTPAPARRSASKIDPSPPRPATWRSSRPTARHAHRPLGIRDDVLGRR